MNLVTRSPSGLRSGKGITWSAASLRALAWELSWKNRILLPVLLLVWVLGAWLAHVVAGAPPDDRSTISFRQAGVVLWLASLMFSFAPFTLMDSHGGWRFSSMTTRWFVLPLPATVLVLLPLALGLMAIASVHWAWSPVVARLLPFTDATYQGVLLLSLMTLLQTLAWLTPRKPAQFWTLAAPLSVLALWLAFAPPTSSHWATERVTMMRILVSLSVALALLSIGVARAHRRGDWPGGFSLALPGWPARKRAHADDTALLSPFAALIWAETRPLWRSFTLSWLTVASLIGVVVIVGIHSRLPDQGWFSAMAVMGILTSLMFWGLLWLVPAGMVAAGESLGVFKTSFTSFRATLPVNAGTLLAPRLLAILLAFLTVWFPIVVLLTACLKLSPHLSPGYPRLAEMIPMLIWFMAVSSHAMIGAFPLLLTGRLEGLPTMLVPTLLAWMGTWQLAGYLGGEGEYAPTAWVVVGLLITKLLLAATGLTLAVHGGHLRVSAAFGAVTAWLVLAAAAAWATSNSGQWVRALAIATLIPCARLAWSPLAVAWNRHRR